MICRLLQDRSTACVECGAPTMVSLDTGADALRYRNLDVGTTPTDRRSKVKQALGMAAGIGGYIGLFAGAIFWVPAIPIILGAGATGIGVSIYRNRAVPIADVELFPVTTAKDAVEIQGIARKLAEHATSAIDGSPVLVEQAVVYRPKHGVMVRRTASVPFLVETDGDRYVVAGVVRVTSEPQRGKLKKGDPAVRALGIPPNLPVAGQLATATVREGDPVRVTGAIAVEMVPELAFHRDGGEVNVMRGIAGAVVAIACEKGA